VPCVGDAQLLVRHFLALGSQRTQLGIGKEFVFLPLAVIIHFFPLPETLKMLVQ
jgi:hypothetical protein